MSLEVQITTRKEAIDGWLASLGLPAANVMVFAMECRRTTDLKGHPGGWEGRIVAEVVTGGSMILVPPPRVEVLKVEGDVLPAVEPEARTFGIESERVETEVGLLGEPVTLFDAPDDECPF